LIQFIAGGDESPYVRTALRDLEAQAKTEKAAIAALLASSEGPIVLPSPDEVRRRGLRLKELLHGEPMAARSALSRLFNGQRLMGTFNSGYWYVDTSNNHSWTTGCLWVR